MCISFPYLSRLSADNNWITWPYILWIQLTLSRLSMAKYVTCTFTERVGTWSHSFSVLPTLRVPGSNVFGQTWPTDEFGWGGQWMAPAFWRKLRQTRKLRSAAIGARAFSPAKTSVAWCRPHFPHLHRHVNARKLLADTRLLASLQWRFLFNQNGQAEEPTWLISSREFNLIN